MLDQLNLLSKTAGAPVSQQMHCVPVREKNTPLQVARLSVCYHWERNSIKYNN